MITTPAVPPALPYTDSDILELVGLAQRMREIKHWEMQAGSKILAEIVGRMHAGLIGRAQACATGGDVPGGLHLAGEGLRPLCGQPESEATQAAPPSEVQIDRIARAYFSEQWAVQHAKDAIHDAFQDARKSASLSPLCGAQHAESGEEAYQVFSHDGGEWYGVDKAQYDRAHDSCRRILAAQQTAPPGPAHETIIREGDNLVCTACGTSAPGTPEAPADLPRLYRFDCYVGKTKMAAGVGVHASTMEEAEQKARKLIDKGETIKFESNQPCHPTRKCSICANYERAAQLDGGQEEGP